MPRGTPSPKLGVTAFAYDAGALIAAERNDRAFWADHRVRLEQGTVPVTPAAVVARVSRSPRQAQLHPLPRGCEVTNLDEEGAHRVGRLLAGTGTSDVVDGAVADVPVARSAAILTGDRDDISRLLRAANADLSVLDV